MDLSAFFKLNYGLYLITTQADGKAVGCVVNTLTQATATPNRMTVILNKDNTTTQAILQSGVFAASVLAQSASMELIGTFGFQSSKEIDKFANVSTLTDGHGVPVVTQQAVARFSCKVCGTLDAGTHVVFLGEVTEAEVLSSELPMTYSYYHEVKKGLTPPKASSYQAPPAAPKGYRCTVCGYILESDTLPPDFICPVCKRGAEVFVPLAQEA